MRSITGWETLFSCANDKITVDFKSTCPVWTTVRRVRKEQFWCEDTAGQRVSCQKNILQCFGKPKSVSSGSLLANHEVQPRKTHGQKKVTTSAPLEFTVCLDTKASWLHAQAAGNCTQKGINSARTLVPWKTQGKEQAETKLRHLLHTFAIETKDNRSFRYGQSRLPFWKNSRTKRTSTNRKNSSACDFLTIPVLVSHHNPLHGVAALPWWERRSNTRQQWTTDHTSRKTQESCTYFEHIQHVQRKVTCQSHLTQLFLVCSRAVVWNPDGELCDPQLWNHHFSPLGTIVPARILQEALLIFVFKQISKFGFLGKCVWTLCLPGPGTISARDSIGSSWKELGKYWCDWTFLSTRFSLKSWSHSGKSRNSSRCNSSSSSWFVCSVSVGLCIGFPRSSALVLPLLSVAGFSLLITVSCDEDVDEASGDEVEEFVERPGTTNGT